MSPGLPGLFRDGQGPVFICDWLRKSWTHLLNAGFEPRVRLSLPHFSPQEYRPHREGRAETGDRITVQPARTIHSGDSGESWELRSSVPLEPTAMASHRHQVGAYITG